MKIVDMLNWLICSSLGHKWHQMKGAFKGKLIYNCKRCGIAKTDKEHKYTFEILLPKQFSGSSMDDDIKL